MDEAMKFEREQRYFVLKRSDVKLLDLPGRNDVTDYLSALVGEMDKARGLNGKPPLSCVVVEADWPERELVWGLIEARMTDQDFADAMKANQQLQGEVQQAIDELPVEVDGKLVKSGTTLWSPGILRQLLIKLLKGNRTMDVRLARAAIDLNLASLAIQHLEKQLADLNPATGG